ncbi:hypothetical protein TSUD_358810 [Trifolium subterraneum]|uniref:RING-type domain-containing protein n=1 Tax=Trifolium subterraneum TaxID=3900 RepID=A0A2Z6MKG8_TRISU|nr:hypothetical protein TSUD_358810 [Trifolium subterraneum]
MPTRLLPPVKSFDSEQNIRHCPICMEEFKRGDLFQPFGVCGHEFHRGCLNSWLQRGKSTCPVCHLDLRRAEIETWANIAGMAMKLLPPVKSFDNEENIRHCPICMEVFKRGDLIQPSGVCDHEFHHGCLNSWLQRGKSTCPVCRLDLVV